MSPSSHRAQDNVETVHAKSLKDVQIYVSRIYINLFGVLRRPYISLCPFNCSPSPFVPLSVTLLWPILCANPRVFCIHFFFSISSILFPFFFSRHDYKVWMGHSELETRKILSDLNEWIAAWWFFSCIRSSREKDVYICTGNTLGL